MIYINIGAFVFFTPRMNAKKAKDIKVNKIPKDFSLKNGTPRLIISFGTPNHWKMLGALMKISIN